MQASTAQICKLYISVLTTIHDMIDIPQLLIDRMVSPQNPLLWTVDFAVSFLFFFRFATINRNPTYSQSVCFLLRICVRVICSTALTILLLARRSAEIFTILHPCCFRYLRVLVC